jgi:hypothetical protein
MEKEKVLNCTLSQSAGSSDSHSEKAEVRTHAEMQQFINTSDDR